MTDEKLGYTWRDRLLHLMTWDGVLAFVSLSMPWLLKAVFGLDAVIVAILSVGAAPILFALLRTGIAEKKLRYICGGRPPVWRQLLLALAIVLLLLFEAVANGIGCSAKPTPEIYFIAGTLYVTYISAMCACLAPTQLRGKRQEPEPLLFGQIRIPRN